MMSPPMVSVVVARYQAASVKLFAGLSSDVMAVSTACWLAPTNDRLKGSANFTLAGTMGEGDGAPRTLASMPATTPPYVPLTPLPEESSAIEPLASSSFQ